MRRFIVKIILFSLLLLSVILIGLILPITPRASKFLLNAKIQKDSLLKNTPNPRIVFVGGSNLSFGINSNLIKKYLDLNPINTAIHASIGLEYMMDNTLKYIKKSDVVVLAPEYNHYYGRFIYGGEVLLRTVANINLLDIFDLKKEQLLNISKYIIKYSFSKFKPTEYFIIKKNVVYSVNSFNKYGDACAHWTKKQQNFMSFSKIKDIYNPNAIKLIKEFENNLKRKGAILYITYPAFQAKSYDKNIEQIKRVERELKKNNFKLLGTPERYRMPNTLMFDTPYHLLKKGADYRTKLLIEDLKKVFSEKGL